jgi:hypothetical protein
MRRCCGRCLSRTRSGWWRLWGLEAGSGPQRQRTSYPDFRDYQEGARRSFEGFAVYRPTTLTLTARDLDPIRVDAAVASRELFPLLRATPLVGRTFTTEEDGAGGPPAVLLSESLWRERWAGRDLLGGTITLDGEPHTIVGVMPASFRFPADARLWIAGRTPGPQPVPGVHSYRVVARLTSGRSRGRPRRGSWHRSRPGWPPPTRTTTRAGPRSWIRSNVRWWERPGPRSSSFWARSSSCCSSPARTSPRSWSRGPAAARASWRVRVALGATARRLVRHLLTETAVVCRARRARGAAGGRVAGAGPRLPGAARLPRLQEVVFDRRVALVCLAVTVLTACLFAAAPAVVATRLQPAEVLRSESGRASAGRRAPAPAAGAHPGPDHAGRGPPHRGGPSRAQPVRAGPRRARLHDHGRRGRGGLPPRVAVRDVAGLGAHVRGHPRPRGRAAGRPVGRPGLRRSHSTAASGPGFEIEGRPPFEKGRQPEPTMRLVSADYVRTTGVRLVRRARPRSRRPGGSARRRSSSTRPWRGSTSRARTRSAAGCCRRWWSDGHAAGVGDRGASVGDVEDRPSLEGEPDGRDLLSPRRRCRSPP